MRTGLERKEVHVVETNFLHILLLSCGHQLILGSGQETKKPESGCQEEEETAEL